MFRVMFGSLVMVIVALTISISGNAFAEDDAISFEDASRYVAGIALAYERATIKSVEEFERNLHDSSSPLHTLSREGLAEFKRGLVFVEAGLGSMNYAPLLRELNEEEMYRIAKLFGVQFEAGLYSSDVFDAEDQLLAELMGVTHVTWWCGGFPPSYDSCTDDDKWNNGEVCVQLENGRTECRHLPLNSCFAGC